MTWFSAAAGLNGNSETVAEPPDLCLGVIILAAGRSRRMGRPKLLLPWGQTSILGHLIGQWRTTGARQIAVVVAAEDQLIGNELDRLSLSRENRILNPEPERGMFSSIICAAQWAGWSDCLTHWVIVLGDQPHLRQETLGKLVDFASKHPGEICQPSFKQRLRHPVVLPKPAFLDLTATQASTLKEFLAHYETMNCPSEDPGLDLDIDQPADYAHSLALAGLSIPDHGSTGVK